MQQLDEVSRHFAHIISGVKAAGKNIFDVKPEAEAKYIELMWKMSPPATGRPSGCTPGYCTAHSSKERRRPLFWQPFWTVTQPARVAYLKECGSPTYS